MNSSALPVALQSRLAAVRKALPAYNFATGFDIILRKSFYTIRGYGPLGTLRNIYLRLRVIAYGLLLKMPGVRSQVDKQVTEALAGIEGKLCQTGGLSKYTNLPAVGWSADTVEAELDKLAGMDHTKWEDGRVSGAVYHGGNDLLKVQLQAYGQFAVANPLHPDVFPGVRKMEAEIVAMVLSLFNAPEGAAGATTSGGTESILMACLSARQKGRIERGITEPEMIVPDTAHAAFDKAGHYFGIKLHTVPIPPPDYKVDVAAVARLINPNTVLLVGSAPNFPHGMVDDIPALSKLAVKYQIPLHVDCCLGSFVIAFLKKSGFPSPYEEQGGFDFRQPGVTSISCDTHKYGFAPKGNSTVLYRNRKLRGYQYFILPHWTGGVYASPSIAGSRPGALIAGCWAGLMNIGENGYIETCKLIINAARRFEKALQKDPLLADNLEVIGKPQVSVVAFKNKHKFLDIYDISDAMTQKGWHLNAMQDPAAIHVAFTIPTAKAVDQLIIDLAEVVAEECEKAEQKIASPGFSQEEEDKKKGDASALYGVAGSIPNKSIISRLAEGFLDTLYMV
ncbi:hypothetical protein KEM56_006575 [Ascosphaera pollenicola]|nr:hypothetical protein KEM56_006575 [Ascosphaera pollenicola]